MVKEDKCCVNILKRTFAIRRPIEKEESILLDGHLQTCVVPNVKYGMEQEVCWPRWWSYIA